MTSFYARTDITAAQNPTINLTGDPSIEITFVAETPTGGPGDMFLEGSPDPDTQVMIGGTNYSFTVNWTATLPTAARDGATNVPLMFLSTSGATTSCASPCRITPLPVR